MASVRRVVTGLDANGKAVVKSDSVVGGADQWSALIWKSESVPPDNGDERDIAAEEPDNFTLTGSVCRYSEIQPGYSSEMHRTATLDFVIVLEGEIEMVLDGGEEVTLRAGDVIVQRGTNHAWATNKGTVPCRVFLTMVEAEPVLINGRPLEVR